MENTGGIQSLRNKMDSYYFSNKYGVEKEMIDIVSADFETIIIGDNSSLLELRIFIENNDLRIENNYNHVSEIIDIESYIDYQAAEMFFNNYDWPGNNSKLWKTKIPGSKWKYIFYDLDDTFRKLDRNMLEHCTA